MGFTNVSIEYQYSEITYSGEMLDGESGDVEGAKFEWSEFVRFSISSIATATRQVDIFGETPPHIDEWEGYWTAWAAIFGPGCPCSAIIEITPNGPWTPSGSRQSKYATVSEDGVSTQEALTTALDLEPTTGGVGVTLQRKIEVEGGDEFGRRDERVGQSGGTGAVGNFPWSPETFLGGLSKDYSGGTSEDNPGDGETEQTAAIVHAEDGEVSGTPGKGSWHIFEYSYSVTITFS